MSVTFQVEDYILVQQEGKKHLLCVDKSSGKTGRGIRQDKFPYEENQVKFEAEEVVANYGKYPKPFIHEAFYKDFTHPAFGSVNFFMKVDKATKEEIETALTKCAKKLKQHNLDGFLPVNVEIRPSKGKMLGHYKTFKQEGELDVMALRPSTEHPLEETIYHESGHGIWKRLIHHRKAKAAWIREYSHHLEVQHLTSKDLKSLLNELLSASQTISDFKQGLSENDQMILREILSYIKKFHRLTVIDLNLLLESGDQDTVTDVWPCDTIALSKIKANNISNYSLKSVEEYFSECLAFYLNGGKLPKHTAKLMAKTIESL